MNPKDKIQVPSIGLIVIGVLGIGLSLFGVLGGTLETFSKTTLKSNAEFAGNILGLAICGGFVLLAILGIVAGIMMRGFRSYALCMAGCIAMVIPCYNSCCGLGMIFGIWGIVALMNPAVKHAFKHVAEGGDPDNIPPYFPPNSNSEFDAPPPPPPPVV